VKLGLIPRETERAESGGAIIIPAFAERAERGSFAEHTVFIEVDAELFELVIGGKAHLFSLLNRIQG